MKIRIANLNIELCPHDAYTERFCAGYLADFPAPDITVDIPDEEILEEQRTCGTHPSFGYAECICIYRKIAYLLPRYDAFVFHAAVVECDGKAFAFAAPSGTGKSTHTALWLQVFGGRARIINGDKPIFRLVDGVWRAYGSPWCGKERRGCNDSAPIAGLCFLERATENRIVPLQGQNILPRLFRQVLIPKERETVSRFLDLLSEFVAATPCYLLSCNMDKEAAMVAYSGMNKEKKDDSQ